MWWPVSVWVPSQLATFAKRSALTFPVCLQGPSSFLAVGVPFLCAAFCCNFELMFIWSLTYCRTFGFLPVFCSGGSVVKNLPANAGAPGDPGSILGPGRSPGKGNGYPFWYSCQDNPTDRSPCWAIVQWVTESDMNWAHTSIFCPLEATNE